MSFFTRLFRKKPSLSSFAVRASRQILPGLVVRPYQPADFPACLQLYKENEPGRFPPDGLEHYAQHLERRNALVLVVKKDGHMLGTAGINSTYQDITYFYWLTYGLVDPRFHGQGIGTVLLLARIALLSEPTRFWLVVMTCVNSSLPFYERFGFRLLQTEREQSPLIAGTCLASVKSRQIFQARRYLRKHDIGLDLNDFVIPLKLAEKSCGV